MNFRQWHDETFRRKRWEFQMLDPLRFMHDEMWIRVAQFSGE